VAHKTPEQIVSWIAQQGHSIFVAIRAARFISAETALRFYLTAGFIEEQRPVTILGVRGLSDVEVDGYT
jgi:hypothetical protein